MKYCYFYFVEGTLTSGNDFKLNGTVVTDLHPFIEDFVQEIQKQMIANLRARNVDVSSMMIVQLTPLGKQT